ncbi:hypothetical protein IFR05_012601 [Cadophora sp. M221]|nr:hypothetical protein IFR05_012601 [Cadophora sp. M221]
MGHDSLNLPGIQHPTPSTTKIPPGPELSVCPQSRDTTPGHRRALSPEKYTAITPPETKSQHILDPCPMNNKPGSATSRGSPKQNIVIDLVSDDDDDELATLSRMKRKVLKAKKPLVLSKLSRGKKYKSQSQYQNSWQVSFGGTSPKSDSISGFQSAIRETPTGDVFQQKQKPEKPNFLKPHAHIVQIQLRSNIFPIYAEFLSWHCPLLAEECEQAPGTLPKSLEDIDVDVIGLFVNWLYTEQVLNKRSQAP